MRFRLAGFVPFWTVLALAAHACLGQILAPMVSVTVAKNQEVIISLPGYSPAGTKLTTYITSLPSVGSLYQLSQVYSDYGYEPKRGWPLTNATSPIKITGSRNRIIYTPPWNTNEPQGKWDWFTYTVTDKVTVSAQGIVWLVPPAGNIVYSDFSVDLDGWTVVQNGARAAALPAGGLLYQPFSRGVLNHYVLATDAEINTNKITGNDDTLWYFVAPPKFMGMNNIAYGGTLTFAMASAAGDFSPSNINAGVQAVVLECASCASGAGTRLVKFADSVIMPLDGQARVVSIPLVESVWLKDPKNILLPWTVPSQCDMVEVLGGITALRILGDQTKWYESVAIDRVAYTVGSGNVPLACASIYY